MDAAPPDRSVDRDLAGTSEADRRRWLRDIGALLALPALWVDHEPPEIAAGLVSVLFGILQLDGAYARFDDPDGGLALEVWRPTGSSAPRELRSALDSPRAPGSGIATAASGATRVTGVPLELPWGTGLVLVSARRSDFPTAVEAHLLRVAVSQGAIAVHAARRLRHERDARESAEELLRRQNEVLRSLGDAVEPSLASIVHRMHDVSRLVAEIDATRPAPGRDLAVGPFPEGGAVGERANALPLSRRETEVLGLLAQGLSNREIAGVMWLSDRTVERHITSLYRKIGVARRSEATAFALRHGVV